MTRRIPDRILWPLAAGCLGLGLALTVVSALKMWPQRGRLDRYARQAEVIRSERASLAPYEAALEAYRRLPKARAADLVGLVKAAFPDLETEIREREPVPGPAGWRVRAAELVVRDAPLARLPGFLAEAESCRPPWRLTGCTVVPEAGRPGMALVTLALEAVERDE